MTKSPIHPSLRKAFDASPEETDADLLHDCRSFVGAGTRSRPRHVVEVPVGEFYRGQRWLSTSSSAVASEG
jgi:hypothetical protein